MNEGVDYQPIKDEWWNDPRNSNRVIGTLNNHLTRYPKKKYKK